jgi:hypothetical protein
LGEEGIRVAHTAVAGRIAPGADNEPDDVAEVARPRLGPAPTITSDTPTA